MLKIIAQAWYKIALFSLITLTVPMFLIPDGSQGHLLAYAISFFSGKSSLMLYDPHLNLGGTALTHMDSLDFAFSADGRIAFVSNRDGDSEVYVFDTHSVHQPPVNISQNPTRVNRPLAWSPDGRYLAFSSFLQGEGALLYVWDSEKLIDITPTNMSEAASSYDVSWSRDGRLAFTVWHLSHSDSPPAEIYLWDGSTTTNLSQSPANSDRAPSWSTDGRLAFRSEGESADILVWDGVSIKNGSPDAASFTNVAPELTDSYSYPVWSNGGLLAFETATAPRGAIPINVWDGQTATNISENKALYDTSGQWSRDGQIDDVTFFSSPLLVYRRDAGNELSPVDYQFAPAWSVDGNSIFCRWGWQLFMWDGQKNFVIAQASEIHAQWQSGAGVVCASG